MSANLTSQTVNIQDLFTVSTSGPFLLTPFDSFRFVSGNWCARIDDVMQGKRLRFCNDVCMYAASLERQSIPLTHAVELLLVLLTCQSLGETRCAKPALIGLHRRQFC